MITAGDERGRTQRGTNNAYCLDEVTSWVDWSAEGCWPEVYDVVRTALRLRRDHETLRQRHWFEGTPTVPGGPRDLVWIHPAGQEMTAAIGTSTSRPSACSSLAPRCAPPVPAASYSTTCRS